MAKKSNAERITACEVEIVNMKDLFRKVCENDLPHIYAELGKLTTFATQTEAYFKEQVEHTKLLKEFDTKLDKLTDVVATIKNQESLGRKEKASILVAIIVSAASIITAFLK